MKKKLNLNEEEQIIEKTESEEIENSEENDISDEVESIEKDEEDEDYDYDGEDSFDGSESDEDDSEDYEENPKKVDDMLIGRIYKKQFAQTKDDIEQIVASKIKQRIDAKKKEFVNRMRGV